MPFALFQTNCLSYQVFSLARSLKVVCPYFAGAEVLNGTFNGTPPEDCGSRTVTVL